MLMTCGCVSCKEIPDSRPEPRLAFILPLIAMLTEEPEMLQPDAFCKQTMQQNATDNLSR